MINRFREPQKNYFEQACKELRNGRKTSHWIWYIFPQIKGLGYSYNSNFYGLAGITEAKEYLADTELRDHLLKACQILIDLNDPDIEKVMGHIDAIKLKSSMTLFHLASKEKIFKQVLDMYFGGQLCQKTVNMVGKDNKIPQNAEKSFEEIDDWKKDGRR